MLSGFQRYFCMQYTTEEVRQCTRDSCVIRISKILLYAIHNKKKSHSLSLMVVLSGFQRYFCMQYTTLICKEKRYCSCVIRISKILLYAIHNCTLRRISTLSVVLSGFQRYFCMQYTTGNLIVPTALGLCYQDFKDTFVCNTQR